MDIVLRALTEDRVGNDITTRALGLQNKKITVQIIARQDCVVAGLKVAREVFCRTNRRIKFSAAVKDGARVKKGRVLAKLSGPAPGILAGERAALNFLQHLSGVATLTRRFVDKVKPYRVKILDTRKTLPGLRELEKYAVQKGGGRNHRADLAAAMLIKDNHIAVVGGVVEAMRRQRGRKNFQIEVGNLSEVRLALAAGARSLLLDNMKPRTLNQAVRFARKLAGRRVLLEASGGVTLKNVRAVAKSGVDRISIGALTHSAPAVDISLSLRA